ncbi:MAG: saccharopine dehydrogenase NADP-binding domain-containing protein [Myxococcales bacterium]|nr:saccharopine dehydrogenase NADP-binding domain-containing protein [Myxococcales bacterium]
MKTVVVFGATGFTGRLVVEALRAERVGEIVLGGRNEARLRELSQAHGGLPFRVADALEPSTLGPLVAGAHVVVSTAGPFTTYGEPLVRAALATGAHFLDTTGEQTYMARILERYHGAATEKRVAVVNAQAFEFALGYCAAALLCEWDPAIHTVDVFNRVYGFGASRGTRESALRQAVEVALIRRGGRLTPRGLSPLPEWVTWPDTGKREPAAPFPGGEALHLVRTHPEVLNVTTNLAMPARVALPLMVGWSARPLLAAASKAGLLEPLRRRIRSGDEGPTEHQREASGFRVLARGQSDVATRGVLVTGRDAYGTTGWICALGAKRLCDGPPNAVGVISTDQAFGAEAFLKALEPHGVRVSRHEM